MLIQRDTALARRGGVLGGCLVVLGLIVVLLIAGGVYVSMNWRGWMADFSVQGAREVLNQSDLSEEQKSAIMVHVEDLAADFKAGDVTLEEMANILQELAESPVIPIAAVYGARAAYFNESGLTDEEKANADLQMQRLARGVFEEQISMEEMQDAIDEIAVQTSESNWHIREPEVVSDEDLREMVDKITVLADEKGIPNEPFEVDIAGEVEQAIKRGRGQIVDDHDSPGEHAGGEHEGADADAGGEHEGGDGDGEHAEGDDAEHDGGEHGDDDPEHGGGG